MQSRACRKTSDMSDDASWRPHRKSRIDQTPYSGAQKLRLASDGRNRQVLLLPLFRPYVLMEFLGGNPKNPGPGGEKPVLGALVRFGGTS
jgi:hypothetical protein